MGLFAQFFPPDLKAQQWHQFTNARQGEIKFSNYIRELQRLQRYILDIMDRQICGKQWDTVQWYLKVKWIEAGINAEVDMLECTWKSAKQFEVAKDVRQRVHSLNEHHRQCTFRQMSQHSRSRQQGTDSTHTSIQQPSNQPPPPVLPFTGPLPNSACPNCPSQASNKAGLSQTNCPENQKSQCNKPKMSQEERNELQEANKCFVCKETGHTAKNCLSCNAAKPLGTYSASIQLVYNMIEEPQKQQEIANLPVASIWPRTTQEININTNTEDESDYSKISYDTVDVDVLHAGLLLCEILEEITQYAKIVVMS
ncbi:Pol polyprotein/retrotransposon [Ceratobasidium sp. AG-Ba]|nr:Pol polyprotein/retrotransposon [Ceratobasidium sp. AG-Ba]QRW11423.1 Pol polyprotein/retrotransposon [Ceratobasidium sp. AG-Ba]